MKYQEVKGNLIEHALSGSFDVIAHGCNCFCVQGAGIAKQMSKTFLTNTGEYHWFYKENKLFVGDIIKLGTIEYENFFVIKYLENITNTVLNHGTCVMRNYESGGAFSKDYTIIKENLSVVNAYTQYQPGANLDYEALTLCLRKINHIFKGKHIGLPKLGCGIAGGIWDLDEYLIASGTDFVKWKNHKNKGFNDVKTIIQEELKDCNVTIVIYDE